MNKNLTKISTVNMSREEWLEHRKNSIGGSESASILGMNPYSSAYTVWADKLGKLPEIDDNEAMRQGRDLEAYVAQRFTEQTGKKVRRENNILWNPDYPFAHANVDRLVVGEDAGLECKTCSALRMKEFKNGAFPDTYYTQCVHYMMVTGCKKWYLAVLVLNKEFMVFEIERDEAEILALAEAEANFWECVRTETPPPTDGSSSTTESIKTIFSVANGGSVNLFGYEQDIKAYMNFVSLIKDLEKQRDEVANRIKLFMGEAGKGETDGHRVSWSGYEKKTFDAKRYAADHPHLDLSQYYNNSFVRPFKITEK